MDADINSAVRAFGLKMAPECGGLPLVPRPTKPPIPPFERPVTAPVTEPSTPLATPENINERGAEDA